MTALLSRFSYFVDDFDSAIRAWPGTTAACKDGNVVTQSHELLSQIRYDTFGPAVQFWVEHFRTMAQLELFSSLDPSCAAETRQSL